MTLEATTTVTREHHQAIARTIQDYTQQLNASNTRAIVDLHSDDAVMFQPDQPTALGTQQLTAAYERAFSGVKCSFTSHIDEILTDGDLALGPLAQVRNRHRVGRRRGHAARVPRAVGPQAFRRRRRLEDRPMHVPASPWSVLAPADGEAPDAASDGEERRH